MIASPALPRTDTGPREPASIPPVHPDQIAHALGRPPGRSVQSLTAAAHQYGARLYGQGLNAAGNHAMFAAMSLGIAADLDALDEPESTDGTRHLSSVHLYAALEHLRAAEAEQLPQRP